MLEAWLKDIKHLFQKDQGKANDIQKWWRRDTVRLADVRVIDSKTMPGEACLIQLRMVWVETEKKEDKEK